MKEIEFVGKHGYAIIDEELEIGIRSIAVPICNAAGEMVAAMSLSVSTSRMTREGVVEHLLPELEFARRHFAALL
jgi:IclR family pca regulon transcriptional regulator